MSPSVEKRINEVARRLASVRVSRGVERNSATMYVRSTKAIDPDTHSPYRSALRNKRR